MTHYSDIDNRPRMLIPELQQIPLLAERNALYLILRQYLSDDEIVEKVKDILNVAQQ